jgi:hypothetical protein
MTNREFFKSLDYTDGFAAITAILHRFYRLPDHHRMKTGTLAAEV